jgi:hypothetical protein
MVASNAVLEIKKKCKKGEEKQQNKEKRLFDKRM